MDFLLNKVENQRKLLGQDLWPKPLQITIIGDGEYEPLMSCRLGQVVRMFGKSLTATAAERCPRNIRRLQKSAPKIHSDFDSNLDSGLSKEEHSC